MKKTSNLKEGLNKHKTGLALGLFLAVVHLIWSVLVALTPGGLQRFMSWVLNLHALEPFMIITTTSVTKALLLMLVTFVFGYVFGWIFASLWNWVKE